MNRHVKIVLWILTLLTLVLGPTALPMLAQDATTEPMATEEATEAPMEGGRVLTDAEQQVADTIANCPSDQALTIAISLPDLAFPFFIHMQQQLRAEAEAIGNIT